MYVYYLCIYIYVMANAFISSMLHILYTEFLFIRLVGFVRFVYTFICLPQPTNSLSSLTRKFIFESRTTICILLLCVQYERKRLYICRLCGTHNLSTRTKYQQQQRKKIEQEQQQLKQRQQQKQRQPN